MGIQSGLIKKINNTNYLNPNEEGVIFDEKVYTDKNGFRVPSKNFKYIGKKNIFILGDSVTFGNGVKEEETFIGLMRNDFKNINILNSSIPGYQIKDHVKVIHLTKKFNNIEKIFYFFTLNDVYGSSNIIDRNNNKKESDYNLKKIKLLNELNIFLRNKSYLYMFVKGVGTDPSKRWFLNLYKFYENKDLSEIKKQFNYLNNFSKNAKSELIVILLPYEYQTRNCKKKFLKPQKKIKEILSELNINFKDFTRKFCNLDIPKNNFYKFDPMHLSSNGHLLVYKTLIDEINF